MQPDWIMLLSSLSIFITYHSGMNVSRHIIKSLETIYTWLRIYLTIVTKQNSILEINVKHWKFDLSNFHFFSNLPERDVPLLDTNQDTFYVHDALW